MTDIHTETIMNTFAKTVNTQDIKLKIGSCTVKGLNMSQKAQVNLDVKAMQDAAQSNDLTVDMQNKLKQKADATTQMFATEIGSSDTVRTNANVLTEAYTQIYTKTRHDCLLDLTNSQKLDVEISGADCQVEDLNLNQDIIATAVMNCSQKAVADNAIIKKIVNDIDQSATSKEENTIAGWIDSFMAGVTGPVMLMMAIGGALALIVVVMFLKDGGAAEIRGAGIQVAKAKAGVP